MSKKSETKSAAPKSDAKLYRVTVSAPLWAFKSQGETVLFSSNGRPHYICGGGERGMWIYTDTPYYKGKGAGFIIVTEPKALALKAKGATIAPHSVAKEKPIAIEPSVPPAPISEPSA